MADPGLNVLERGRDTLRLKQIIYAPCPCRPVFWFEFKGQSKFPGLFPIYVITNK